MSYSVMMKSNTEESLGTVLELFISKKSTKKILIDLNGIINDKFYAININRSVLISSIYSYQLANKKDINLSFGELGENILIDYNPYQLQTGTQLKIGETLLEISQPCTLCKSLTKIDNKLPKLLKDDRGIFAKVIKGGSIYLNDKIYIV